MSRAGALLAVVLLAGGAFAGVASAEFSTPVVCDAASTLMLASASSVVTGTLTEVVSSGDPRVVSVPLQPGSTLVLPCAGSWTFAAPDAPSGNYVVGVFPNGAQQSFWLAAAGLVCGGLFALVMVRAVGP